MKKKAGIVAVTIVFVAIFVIRIIGVEVLLPEDDPEFDILLYESNDGRLNDHYISADTCREFFDRHKDSLEIIAETIRKQPTDTALYISYNIIFDNDGMLSIYNGIEYDEVFVEALHEIYTDEIFQLNPYCEISIWYSRGEESWYIDFQLFKRRSTIDGVKYSMGGIKYVEYPWGKNDSRFEGWLDEHWLWYNYSLE